MKNPKILAEFKTSFTIRLTELDFGRIRRALNIFYCGAEIPPDEVTEAHMNSHYAICRTHSFDAVCGVDKDGKISILHLVPPKVHKGSLQAQARASRVLDSHAAMGQPAIRKRKPNDTEEKA